MQFCFPSNSHGFYGEREGNKKFESVTALHLLPPAFPDKTLPS